MRGVPDLNFPEFRRVSALLRAQGHDVISPAEMDEEGGYDPSMGEEGFDLRAAILRDLNAVSEVEAVVLLPGWRASKGARAEEALARFLDLQVYEWTEEGLVPVEATVLEEAQRLIHGARNQDYGHPREDFARTAQMWSAITGFPLTAQHVPMMMIALKLSRMVQSPGKRDHVVDVAGYAGTIERLWE